MLTKGVRKTSRFGKENKKENRIKKTYDLEDGVRSTAMSVVIRRARMSLVYRKGILVDWRISIQNNPGRLCSSNH